MSSDRVLSLLGAVLALSACRPDFGLPVSVITEPRVLTVELTPPEARPGDAMSFAAVAVTPDGPSTSPLEFAWCTSPRPLTEDNVVSADCLGPAGQVTPIATGALTATSALPGDACGRFGPETPPQPAGQPPLRPRDPDITGGYYQPLRVVLSAGVEAIALVRVRCNLPGASAQRAAEFSKQYVDNTNPQLSGIELERAGAPVAASSVPANTTVRLHVSWPEQSAETYLVHDRATDSNGPRREALRVSWFTTSGVIPIVTTGRSEDDLATETSTEWQTPASGRGTLWAVLRDSRGGSTVRALDFSIQ